MSNAPIVDALKTVLADTYALYLKTQNYHWNVEGPQFKALHDLFELQYNDLFTAIDELAELIRTLGHKAPGSLAFYADTTKIKPGDENNDAKTMVADLRDSQDQIVETLKVAHDIAAKADDEVVADMMIGRMTVHRKNRWMLDSMISA